MLDPPIDPPLTRPAPQESCSNTWNWILILGNLARMCKTLYDGRVSVTPAHLRAVYAELAAPLNVSRGERKQCW